ncbi:MAG: cytochrome c [Bdellovibrionales bacterium]|nr:cytochrome c [Bdellovibrionales bacterium]
MNLSRTSALLLLILAVASSSGFNAGEQQSLNEGGSVKERGVDRSLYVRSLSDKHRKKKRRQRICKHPERRGVRYYCEYDNDNLRTKDEWKYKTNPFDPDTDDDSLLDGDEVKIFGTDPLNPDTDGDGIPDGEEDNDGNGISDGAQGDQSSKTCDTEGNTTGFGIPTGFIGNIFEGEILYNDRCLVCHAGITKGQGLEAPRVVAAIAQFPMNITLQDQQLAHLVAFLNASNCEIIGAPSPTPTPTSSSPTPTPSSCFDASGNTTEFGIPVGKIGNFVRGDAVYANRCASCHPGIRKGEGRSHAALQTALALPVMQISLPEQELADLVAFLNLYNCPNGGGPTPTPTPEDPIERGRLEYIATCSSCHSNPREFRELTPRKLNEAIREKSEMRGITYTPDLFAYFGSLSGN